MTGNSIPSLAATITGPWSPLAEGKSRLSLLGARGCLTKVLKGVKQAIIDLLSPLKAKVHTLTSDNGKEFAVHQCIAKSLDAKFIFAHPYASWKRDLNGNMNGLIRQYFPKTTKLT